ncbi:MAG: VanZ family protein [Thermoanaerobaculales bacterium]|jgi:hypothetical protein|nr:VanZ family protein [Thermoanaerobaculales bacterium]
MYPSLRRWLPVLAWVVVIYTTIPFVRGLREWFTGRWDAAFIAWLVAASLAAAALAAVLFVLRRPTRLRRGGVPWVIAVTVVLVAWTFHLRRSPEEAVHFIEYGILAFLIHRALRPAMPDALVFVAGALIGAVIGTLDEVIQWLVPDRFWDWRDLVLNAGAGGLVQLALWRIVPASGSPPAPASVRTVLRWSAALTLLLTLCLANTPRLVARYAPRLPGAAHLASSHNPMAEYGHRHVVTGLGSFKSRLDLDEIEAQDRTRSAEVAEVVDRYRHRYGEFLDTWPVAEDGFTYELRVHLFARDRNLAKARQRKFNGSAAQEHLDVAWRENEIVERFFGRTLAASSYRWKPQLRQRVAAMQDAPTDFRSAAGSHLITFASEGGLRVMLLGLVVGLVLADFALGRYHRGPQ